jgi:hypothetical protein
MKSIKVMSELLGSQLRKCLCQVPRHVDPCHVLDVRNAVELDKSVEPVDELPFTPATRTASPPAERGSTRSSRKVFQRNSLYLEFVLWFLHKLGDVKTHRKGHSISLSRDVVGCIDILCG